MTDLGIEAAVPEGEYRALDLRARPEEIERRSVAFRSDTIVEQMLDAVPDPYVAVNRRLQVLFANEALAAMAGRDRASLFGERLGEIVGCINADIGPGGCGTSPACRTCGITGSILEALNGNQVVREARLTLSSGRSVDVRVQARLMDGTAEAIVLVSVVDIEHEQRRRVLERTFFHDILNTAGGVQGLVGLLPVADSHETPELLELLDAAATQLVDEIEAQRLLSCAEAGDLRVKRATIDASDLVADVIGVYANHDVGIEKQLILVPPAPGSKIEFESDLIVVRRILGNLVKNALEASEPCMTVTLGVREHADAVEFWVHNDGVIPRDVRFQIFQRSFSTKGVGRGIGTYSVRLFTETILHGEVTFASSEEEGTTFSVRLPRVKESTLTEPARRPAPMAKRSSPDRTKT